MSGSSNCGPKCGQIQRPWGSEYKSAVYIIFLVKPSPLDPGFPSPVPEAASCMTQPHLETRIQVGCGNAVL